MIAEWSYMTPINESFSPNVVMTHRLKTTVLDYKKYFSFHNYLGFINEKMMESQKRSHWDGCNAVQKYQHSSKFEIHNFFCNQVLSYIFNKLTQGTKWIVKIRKRWLTQCYHIRRTKRSNQLSKPAYHFTA